MVLVGLMFALVPFVFFPFFTDFFDLPKRLIFIVATLVLVLIWGVHAFAKKAITITPSLLSTLWLLLSVSSLVSILMNPANQIASVFGMGGFIIALGIFVFVAGNMIARSLSSMAVSVLTFIGILLSLFEIVDRFGASPILLFKSYFGANVPSTGFSFTGGPFVSALFLGIVATMLVVKVVTQHTKGQEKVLTGLYAVLIGAGLLSCLYLFLPGKATQPQFLPQSAAWNVAVDILKDGRTALFGVGPDNYINAFSSFRPVSLNQTKFWQVRFESSRSGILHLLTTQGVVGLGIYILLIVTIAKNFWNVQKESYPILAGLLLTIIFSFLFPFSVLSFTLAALLTVVLISDLKGQEKLVQHSFLFASVKSKHDSDQVISASRIGPAIVTLVIVLGFGGAFFFLAQFVRAEMIMAQANRKLGQDNVRDGYLGVQQAVRIMPMVDRNRRQLGVVAISIAQALAKKENPTEQDKQTIVQLIQQAINEAKAAVALNPGNPTNWETLASIYRVLIGSADKADEWTNAAFTQAIKVDPTNPLLRLELGNVYAAAKNYTQASRLYEQSASLKPDLPAPYYAMSVLAKATNDRATEKALLEKTLSLLPSDSKDKTAIEKLLDEAKAALPASGSGQKTTDSMKKPVARDQGVEDLTKPTASPLPVKVELPKDAGVASDSGATSSVPKQ